MRPLPGQLTGRGGSLTGRGGSLPGGVAAGRAEDHAPRKPVAFLDVAVYGRRELREADLPFAQAARRRTARRRAAGQVGETADDQLHPRLRLDFLDAQERLQAHPPELVAAIVLRELCQLGYAEIAAELGVRLGTLTSRVHHVHRSLALP